MKNFIKKIAVVMLMIYSVSFANESNTNSYYLGANITNAGYGIQTGFMLNDSFILEITASKISYDNMLITNEDKSINSIDGNISTKPRIGLGTHIHYRILGSALLLVGGTSWNYVKTEISNTSNTTLEANSLYILPELGFVIDSKSSSYSGLYSALYVMYRYGGTSAYNIYSDDVTSEMQEIYNENMNKVESQIILKYALGYKF